MPKILAFSGSARRDSVNQKVLTLAVAAAREAGATVTVVNLRDYQMPLYDGDWEAEHGLPAGAVAFKQALREHDGFLIASPEYNSMPSPLLKNAIDWATRRAPGEGQHAVFKGKAAALLAASPGALAGIRGLYILRYYLMNISCLVLPGEVAVSAGDGAFDAAGNLVDTRRQEAVQGLAVNLVRFLSAHP